MEISIRTLGKTQVLDLWGATSADAHHLLRERFLHAIDYGPNYFIMNLSHATALDSLTLGETVACVKRARERGGDVKLVVIPDSIVHELLQLTGLDRVLEIFGDENEAAVSFSRPPA
jgi:anti-anti-sigma factor